MAQDRVIITAKDTVGNTRYLVTDDNGYLNVNVKSTGSGSGSISALIDSAETETSVLTLPDNYSVSGLIIPAMDDSTTITFFAGITGTVYPLYDEEGIIYSVTASNTFQMVIVALDPSRFYPFKTIKLKIGSGQTSLKDFKIIIRNY